MKILVPIKVVSDPDNANKVKVSPDGTQVVTQGMKLALNPFDDYAIEAALRFSENPATKQKHHEIVVATLGAKHADVTKLLRQSLAMGADRAIHVVVDDDALDSSVVAATLKALVDKEKPELVLMGKQAVDGDSNATGQMLAELLAWPMATSAAMFSGAQQPTDLTVGRETDSGLLTMKVKLPAVVTVDLRILLPDAVQNGLTAAADLAKFYRDKDRTRIPSLPNVRAAQSKPLEEVALASLSGGIVPRTRYARFELPPARSGGPVYVESVAQLVDKLRNEAKVL